MDSSKLSAFHFEVNRVLFECDTSDLLDAAGAAGIVNSFLDEYLDFGMMEKVHKLL